MEERLIEIFKEYLPAWSWEEWQAAGASDKEDIVINALADLGPDMPIEVDEAYDIFGIGQQVLLMQTLVLVFRRLIR